MINPWTIYWTMQLDSIRTLLGFWSLACGIIAIIAFSQYIVSKTIGRCNDHEFAKQHEKLMFKVFKYTFVALIICMTMRAFVPSTKTMCTVLTVPMFVNNEMIQTDAHDIYTLGVEKLKETMYPEQEQE